jgi:hypothetical protein
MKIDSKTRRKLRRSLGSRVMRRAGIKSHGNRKPRDRLKEKIAEHLRSKK